MELFKMFCQAYLILPVFILIIPNAQASEFPNEQDQIVKIGLLIPDNKSIATRQGAEIAVRKANEMGGFNGHPFQLVTRSMEGPWGTGSKEAVNLIFDEKVWALLGSHDGRKAHLVEQAATKSTVVFMSAWAGDPTLSQAFIPWFFNCVPNDRQQAAALTEEIYTRRKFNKVAVIYDNYYDSKTSLKNFLKKSEIAGKTDPVQFFYEDYYGDTDILFDQIGKTDMDCIVLFCKPSSSSKIIQQIRQRKMNQPVFGPLFLLNEDELSEKELHDYDNLLLIPSGVWTGTKYSGFTEEYRKAYGRMPGMVAAYAFDGMNLLIQAIIDAGASDREKIQESLKNIHYDGVTGPIKFDDMGNRSGTFKIVSLENGLPIAAER